MSGFDKDVTNEELKNFFLAEYPSTLFAKIIVDSKTKISKGYGFVDVSSHEEYTKILGSKSKKVFKGKTLVIK